MPKYFFYEDDKGHVLGSYEQGEDGWTQNDFTPYDERIALDQKCYTKSHLNEVVESIANIINSNPLTDIVYYWVMPS